MALTSILWRRLDVPGHDACRLERRDTGWLIEGMAVFGHDQGPARLVYSVRCDESWRALDGRVHGRLGDQAVDSTVVRTAEGDWLLNGARATLVGDCIDLDFGFTPATNLPQIRRLALDVGQAADAPAAWLDVVSDALSVLPQRYQRRAEGTYWYEAPTLEYATTFDVTSEGFVTRYPGLWEMER